MPPPSAHAHWHIDASYLNLSGTFYYLCSILDGYSRSIVHYEFRLRQDTLRQGDVVVRIKDKAWHGITAGNIDADIS